MAIYIDANHLYCRVKTEANPYGKPTIDYKSGVKVLDMIENQPTADVVEVDKVAEMFAEQFGDKCPCNFNDNDEWLTLYCDYTNTCDCPCKDGWKQFIKHYDKRKER